MGEKRVGDLLVSRLGGPPGPYAVVSVAIAAIWLPIELLFDRDEPIAEIVVGSGLRGAMWALAWLALGWLHRRRTGAGDDDLPPRRERARRGAVVGAGVGVPFFGGLIALSLSTGRSGGYVAIFALVLVIMAVVAARSLRHSVPA